MDGLQEYTCGYMTPACLYMLIAPLDVYGCVRQESTKLMWYRYSNLKCAIIEQQNV